MSVPRSQTGLVAGLAGVLQLPRTFWHGGDLDALAAKCDANFFRFYDWKA